MHKLRIDMLGVEVRTGLTRSRVSPAEVAVIAIGVLAGYVALVFLAGVWSAAAGADPIVDRFSAEAGIPLSQADWLANPAASQVFHSAMVDIGALSVAWSRAFLSIAAALIGGAALGVGGRRWGWARPAAAVVIAGIIVGWVVVGGLYGSTIEIVSAFAD